MWSWSLSLVVSEVFDLSSNALTGSIPEEFNDFMGLVLFKDKRL